MGAKKDALKAKKVAFFERVKGCLSNYNKCIIVGADNVGSKQFGQIRQALRGKAELVMGKNTMLRKAFELFLEENPGHGFGQLKEKLKLNIGLVFTNDSLTDVRDVITANVVEAPARVGAIAPFDVIVPAGPTGADPGKTGFFQALSIPTKIVRGQIEIINDVHLISEGEKVSPGSAALLKSLDIKPFFYGLKLVLIYDDGAVYDPVVLDLSDDVIRGKFMTGVRNVASLSLVLGMPNAASIPHSLNNALKRLVSLCIPDDVDYSFEKAEPYLKFLADPSAFAAPAAAATGGEAAAAVEEEEEEEEEAVGVGGLFGDSDSDDDDSDSDSD